MAPGPVEDAGAERDRRAVGRWDGRTLGLAGVAIDDQVCPTMRGKCAVGRANAKDEALQGGLARSWTSYLTRSPQVANQTFPFRRDSRRTVVELTSCWACQRALCIWTR